MSSKQSKPYHVVDFPADSSGCNFYRMQAPRMAVQSVQGNVSFCEMRRLLADQDWFTQVNLVNLQRQVSHAQKDYFMKYLVPLSKQVGFWISYNIDDALHRDDIPKYNQAWETYQQPGFAENITEMIQATDFLVVTTQYIKDYYIRKFGADENSTLIMPNFIPKWWLGQYYHPQKISIAFDTHKKRPRIGVIASGTHFDIHENNNNVDDFTHIVPFIRSTVNQYEWVFVGTFPKQVADLVRSGKITYVQGSNILNYPDVIGNLNCQAIVQPLIDNEFNRCKSNIKLLESSAIGTPLIAQDLDIYSKYTDLTFKDSNDLQNQLDKLFSNKQFFTSRVKQQYNELTHGRSGKGWWLENNVDMWANFYKMTKKCVDIDVKKLIDYEKLQEAQGKTK